jgi:1-aminocyclopropane-1-carboxylate deaminase/D-cysteine desulfhydrase-like pyridoxal-dependent ACC family enzyme|tara:strand:+ start:44 stop:1018 length:975 start_codon:yes stop_codon:yes gene_type:complete
VINFDNFTIFSEEHFHPWISKLTPLEEHKGYLLKRDDRFNLCEINGGKLRQCSKLVYDNLDYIKGECKSGILTASGLPSPQPAIVSAVAKYFGLKCVVTIPHYPDHLKDFNRINASLSQKLGAKVYGVGNPNLSGPELDAKKLVQELGYFQIKFGMNGYDVMRTVANQVENIPDELENLVCIAGSGLSCLGVMMGIRKFNKNVKNVYAVYLSDYMNKNKKMWYDKLSEEEKYDGNLHMVKSEISYQVKHKIDNSFKFDLTYESKAWDWMVKNINPSLDTLFWVVGRKIYDLSVIEKIDWHKSYYEQTLDIQRENRIKPKEHGFF